MKLLLIIPTALARPNNLIETFVSILKNTSVEYNLLIVKNNYRGFAHSVNEGLKIVAHDKTYDGCILINDDVIFASQTWLEKLLEKKDKYDIISCKGNINDKGNHVAFWGTYISRKVIKKIGFLDEQFLVGECEDVDYCFRALSAGFKISDSECEAFHKAHGTLSTLNKAAKNAIKGNQLKLLLKYKGTRWEPIIREFQNEKNSN